MSYSNINNPTLSRSFESTNDNFRSRSNSPAHTIRSKTGSAFIQDSHSISSTKSVKSYPRKGTTLANANLTVEEQNHLEEVLSRFDKFRQIEDKRVKQLRQEMIDKQKARIKNSESIGEGRCNNCNTLFVPLLQPAIRCVNCHGDFCRMCTEKLPNTNVVMCKFCRFETLHKCKLGVWFTEQLKQARASGRVRGVSGPEALRSSIQRIQREARSNTPRSRGANVQELIQQHRRLSGTFSFGNTNETNNFGKNDKSRSMTLFYPKDEVNEEPNKVSEDNQFLNRDRDYSIFDNCSKNNATEDAVDEQLEVNHQDQHVGSTTTEEKRQSSSKPDKQSKSLHSSTPQLNQINMSKEANLHKQNPGFSSSECYSPSLGSDTASLMEKKLNSSYTDLTPGKIPITHQKNFDSEAESRTNLSVASGVYPDSIQNPTKFNSVKVLNVQDRRKSSSLNEFDIIRMYDYEATPLSKINETDANKAREKGLNPAQSFSYVKCYLLPDRTKGSKRKTSYKKATCNPVYDEEFKYHILKQDLTLRTLQVSVWHHNALGLNLFLGEIFLPLTFHQFDQASHWYTLGEHRFLPTVSHLQVSRGEIVLAIKLVPGETGSNRGEIHVWIKSARGLSASTDGMALKKDNVDPYVKIYMLPGKEKHSKQKTKVVRKNNNPEWNQAIIYRDIILNSLNEIGIEISVWDYDRFTSNDFLGGCRINCGSHNQPWLDAMNAEKSAWLAMCERPNIWIEATIQLRSSLN
ncbi:synaptotagmin-like protein [Schistosoma bovis]|uniref:Synaptotagmin-like protein n=1 Tax=Schistosoma bovis TaxID=6184 RepID=A0A430QHY9_SCHBO|nr:synaptotagmin-like protein [Schistosoma bovis]